MQIKEGSKVLPLVVVSLFSIVLANHTVVFISTLRTAYSRLEYGNQQKNAGENDSLLNYAIMMFSETRRSAKLSYCKCVQAGACLLSC